MSSPCSVTVTKVNVERARLQVSLAILRELYNTPGPFSIAIFSSSSVPYTHTPSFPFRSREFLLPILPFDSMTCLRFWLSLATVLLTASTAIATRHPHMKRALSLIAQVSQSQMDSLTPVARYASASYCPPSSTLAWNCTDCQANPSFHPIAAGGNSVTVQYCKCSGSIRGKGHY